MVKIIILAREGNLIYKDIQQNFLDELINLDIYQMNMTDIEELYSLPHNNYEIKLFGLSNDNILKDNLHEFHKPLDCTIFVGNLILLKLSKTCNRIVDINFLDCQKIVNILN